MFLLMEEELSVVLSDDLISIMDKPVKERTPEEQEAYIAYLEGVWKLADRKLLPHVTDCLLRSEI